MRGEAKYMQRMCATWICKTENTWESFAKDRWCLGGSEKRHGKLDRMNPSKGKQFHWLWLTHKFTCEWDLTPFFLRNWASLVQMKAHSTRLDHFHLEFTFGWLNCPRVPGPTDACQGLLVPDSWLPACGLCPVRLWHCTYLAEIPERGRRGPSAVLCPSAPSALSSRCACPLAALTVAPCRLQPALLGKDLCGARAATCLSANQCFCHEFQFSAVTTSSPTGGCHTETYMVQKLRPACLPCRGIVFGLHIMCCPRAMESHEWVGEATRRAKVQWREQQNAQASENKSKVCKWARRNCMPNRKHQRSQHHGRVGACGTHLHRHNRFGGEERDLGKGSEVQSPRSPMAVEEAKTSWLPQWGEPTETCTTPGTWGQT